MGRRGGGERQGREEEPLASSQIRRRDRWESQGGQEELAQSEALETCASFHGGGSAPQSASPSRPGIAMTPKKLLVVRLGLAVYLGPRFAQAATTRLVMLAS